MFCNRKKGSRCGVQGCGGGFAEILRLRSQLFWHSLSHIRRFSSLRMTKRGDARRSLDGRWQVSLVSPAFPAWGIQRGGDFAAQKGSQPRLAALGSPFQGKGLAWTRPPSYGRRCPEGAEVGWGNGICEKIHRTASARRHFPITACMLISVVQ